MKHVLGHQRSWKKLLLIAKNVRCNLEFAQHCRDWPIHDWYRVIFSDGTKINRFQYDGHVWCWVKDGESQLQAHHVNQTIKHGGGTILCGVVLYDFPWHKLHVQNKGEGDTSFVY